jgi:EpsI family protein
MTLRVIALATMVMCVGVWARTAGPRDIAPDRPLSALPLTIGEWHGINGPDIEPDVARVLRADDYVNRVYRGSDGAVVGLWIAFYASQRQGDAIHSPLNCLPGTGWTPLTHTRPELTVDGRSFPVNRYLTQKRGERQLVLYWYEGRGRVAASEYTNKIYLLIDAIRLKRTDGALVRVTAPVHGDERRADRAAVAFIAAARPHVARWLP